MNLSNWQQLTRYQFNQAPKSKQDQKARQLPLPAFQKHLNYKRNNNNRRIKEMQPRMNDFVSEGIVERCSE